jgi:OmpA-OmpF porin, OOP family
MFRAVTRAFVLGCAISAAAVASAQVPAAGANADFIVFFDWAKPEINRDAAEILDKVAAQYAGQPGERLVLAGHSDRSGPAGANLRSSRKRAEAVRDYLAAHGVPANAISVQAYGEDQPIVPTEDGVREVQNRRVEIRFVPAG